VDCAPIAEILRVILANYRQAIVRFRWLEAASGTVCRPTSPQL